ncbi:6846_t:CDS:2, partial [Funneliformis mosseae]
PKISQSDSKYNWRFAYHVSGPAVINCAIDRLSNSSDSLAQFLTMSELWNIYFDTAQPKDYKSYKLKMDLANLKKYGSDEMKTSASKLDEARKQSECWPTLRNGMSVVSPLTCFIFNHTP